MCLKMSKFIGSRKDLIKNYGNFIVKATKGTGILPGTLITQLIVESQGKIGGVNMVGGSSLSRNANNYFGIKASSNWNSAKYAANTVEYINGMKLTTTDYFRKYNSIEESILDYIKFLKSNPRYKDFGVFAQSNVENQLKAMQKAGYATNPSYAQLLISVYTPLKSEIEAIKPTFPLKKVLTITSILSISYAIIQKFRN